MHFCIQLFMHIAWLLPEVLLPIKDEPKKNVISVLLIAYKVSKNTAVMIHDKVPWYCWNNYQIYFAFFICKQDRFTWGVCPIVPFGSYINSSWFYIFKLFLGTGICFLIHTIISLLILLAIFRHLTFLCSREGVYVLGAITANHCGIKRSVTSMWTVFWRYYRISSWLLLSSFIENFFILVRWRSICRFYGFTDA